MRRLYVNTGRQTDNTSGLPNDATQTRQLLQVITACGNDGINFGQSSQDDKQDDKQLDTDDDVPLETPLKGRQKRARKGGDKTPPHVTGIEKQNKKSGDAKITAGAKGIEGQKARAAAESNAELETVVGGIQRLEQERKQRETDEQNQTVEEGSRGRDHWRW